MKLKINFFRKNLNNTAKLSYINVSDSIFKFPINLSLIHQVISSYMINSRQGSKAQKNRSEVSGSNKKPWRQKGTGRARSGSVKSPIWRSGGVTFASKSKKYHQKINKKMYKGAIKSILSKLVHDNRLFLIEDFFLKEPKTKLLLEIIKPIVSNKSVLIIIGTTDNNIFLSARNLYKVFIRDSLHMDPVSLINYDITLITTSAINKIEQQLI